MHPMMTGDLARDHQEQLRNDAARRPRRVPVAGQPRVKGVRLVAVGLRLAVLGH